MADSPQIAVVIPFFQRREKVLKRALASVAQQTGLRKGAVEVIVVDDQSPISAAAEIQASPGDLSVKILQRKNGGPGAARNTALDSLTSTVDYVAFLDSDDEWAEDHLARAVDALEESGCSFYFCNFFQLGAKTPAFERGGKLDLTLHRQISEDVYVYDQDMSVQILSGNLIGTSTVVFRTSQHRGLRFRPKYRRAGEDYLMWLDFWRDGAKFVFRTTPSVVYKEGVNVFSGVEWGTFEHLERTSDEICYLREALESYPLSEESASALKVRIAERRRHYRGAFPTAMRRSPIRTLKQLLGK